MQGVGNLISDSKMAQKKVVCVQYTFCIHDIQVQNMAIKVKSS